MAKDPAVLFYTSDFLVGVQGLTMQERGEYITLLCLQHLKGHLTEKEIKLTVGTVSEDVLKKFTTDENGLYFNERMDNEIVKRENFSRSRSENGKKGGRPQKTTSFSVALAKKKLAENENININDISILESNTSLGEEKRGVGEKEEKNDAQFDVLFDRFWQSYPRKVSKQEARRAFIKLKPTEAFTDMLIKAVMAQKKWDKGWQEDVRFIPHASTWLNQARWEDEQTKIPAKPRYGNFDPEEAMERAIARSFKKEVQDEH